MDSPGELSDELPQEPNVRTKPVPEARCRGPLSRQRPREKHHRERKPILNRSKKNFPVPEKPSWMSKGLYYNRMNMTCNSMTTCQGCDTELPVLECGRRTIYSVIHMVHCIQDCEAYQELGLVRTCSTCGQKFLNEHSRTLHQTRPSNTCDRD